MFEMSNTFRFVNRIGKFDNFNTCNDDDMRRVQVHVQIETKSFIDEVIHVIYSSARNSGHACNSEPAENLTPQKICA
jgi:hypothetical protein